VSGKNRNAQFAFTLVLLLCAPVVGFGALEVAGHRLVDDGKPVFLKGAMYYQPHAYWDYCLQDLDEKMVPDDMALMKSQGFTMVEVQVNWGDVMKHVDPETGKFVLDEERLRRLVFLITEARKQGLYVGLWFQNHVMPYGFKPAPEEYPPVTDLGGFEHREGPNEVVRGLNVAPFEQNHTWKAFLAWFAIVAERTKDIDGLYYDPLDWQMLNHNYWDWADEGYGRAWRRHLKAQNPSLAYWNEKFGEESESWDDVLLPVDEWAVQTICKAATPYQNRQIDPYDGAKWTQWRVWNRPVARRIRIQVVEAIRKGDPDALIAYRPDLWRYGDWRGELAWIPGIDFVQEGFYPNPDREDRWEEDIRRIINRVGEHLGNDLPMVFCETGMLASQMYPNLSPDEQEQKMADYARVLRRVLAKDSRVCGFMWWCWRDCYANEGSMTDNPVGLDNRSKPAVEALIADPDE